MQHRLIVDEPYSQDAMPWAVLTMVITVGWDWASWYCGLKWPYCTSLLWWP